MFDILLVVVFVFTPLAVRICAAAYERVGRLFLKK
jgi:ABC-type Fe3+ transport system permease subunit